MRPSPCTLRARPPQEKRWRIRPRLVRRRRRPVSYGVGRGEHLHDVGHETSPIAKLTDETRRFKEEAEDKRRKLETAVMRLEQEMKKNLTELLTSYVSM